MLIRDKLLNPNPPPETAEGIATLLSVGGRVRIGALVNHKPRLYQGESVGVVSGITTLCRWRHKVGVGTLANHTQYLVFGRAQGIPTYTLLSLGEKVRVRIFYL